jgi:DNA/RNA endonuclease YhcR with UshA esterase domain
MEEDTKSTPILDANETESMLYNGESIPITGRLDNDEGENKIYYLCALNCIMIFSL